MMFHMQLLHAKGIANLSYVVHAYVLVTYDMNILTLWDIMWLYLNIMRIIIIYFASEELLCLCLMSKMSDVFLYAVPMMLYCQ